MKKKSPDIKKRKKLIEKTLLPFDSTVQISFKNNIPHVIRRKSISNEISLKIGMESSNRVAKKMFGIFFPFKLIVKNN